MRRALLVGIDHYDNFLALSGCVNDVAALEPVLARHEDGSPNFTCQTRTCPGIRVTRDRLLRDLVGLFGPGADLALFYFAGHGAIVNGDVVLAAADGTAQTPGVGLAEIMAMVAGSKVPAVTIILDCCFSGAAATIPQFGAGAHLRDGVAILTASREDQTSAETPVGRGVFSTYLYDALDGGAADIRGLVTVANVYAYLDESFGPWDQRPMFKANVERLQELRRCVPAVPVHELRRLPEFFPDAHGEFDLDPSFEPEAEPRQPEHEAVFAILQRCRAAQLVEPVGVEHMYFAAMQSRSCRLTKPGRHYRRLAAQGRL
jgi:hypothetical protein